MKHFKSAIFALFAACLLTVVVGVAQADSEPASIEAEAFRRLTTQAAAINEEGPVGPRTTGPLGLEESLVVRQIKVIDGSDAHYFNVVMDGSGRFILFSRIDGIVYAFALDAQRRPTSAAIRREGKSTPVTIDSVRPQLMKMMAFWIDWAARNTTK